VLHRLLSPENTDHGDRLAEHAGGASTRTGPGAEVSGMASTAVTRVPAALAGGLFEVGDAPVGGRELVFEADDAPGRGQGHVLIEQFADPGGQREPGPAGAALPTRGATRAEQASGIQAAQKGGLHTEQLRGCAYGVGRVVNNGSSIDRIRADRILHEALTAGPDPLHLSLVFNISHATTTATRP
jgi:hypothetical protein